MKKTLALFLILVLSFYGCASGKSQRERDFPGEPDVARNIAQEVAVGEQIHSQIMSSFYPYTDPKVVTYVEQIGNSLVTQAKRKNLPYRFTLLYSDKIYATSAPGGFIYVTTGLIYFLDNEAELAGVLAHEIGQLQHQDPRLSPVKKAVKSVIQGGSMIAPAFGQFGMLAVLGFVMMDAMMGATEKSSDQVLVAADKHALDYMVGAGYDPQGLMDVMDKFIRSKEELMPYFYDYYQSRPITEERWQALQKAFEKLPLEGKSFDTNRQIFQEMTKGVREIHRV